MLLSGEAPWVVNIKGKITWSDRERGLLFSNNLLSRINQNSKKIALVPSRD